LGFERFKVSPYNDQSARSECDNSAVKNRSFKPVLLKKDKFTSDSSFERTEAVAP